MSLEKINLKLFLFSGRGIFVLHFHDELTRHGTADLEPQGPPDMEQQQQYKWHHSHITHCSQKSSRLVVFSVVAKRFCLPCLSGRPGPETILGAIMFICLLVGNTNASSSSTSSHAEVPTFLLNNIRLRRKCFFSCVGRQHVRIFYKLIFGSWFPST